MSLPTDYAERKAIPLYSFLTGYFPLAIIEMVKVAVEGNKQHNPGEPLHWARGKSMDQLNTAMRHQFDHGMGQTYDTDGTMHLAKAMWRLGAEIQLIKEREALEAQHGLPAGTAAELEKHGITVVEDPEWVGDPKVDPLNPDTWPGFQECGAGAAGGVVVMGPSGALPPDGFRMPAAVDSGLPQHVPGQTVDL